MIDLQWLSERLCEVVAWQLANPGSTDGPEIPWGGRRIWAIFLALNATRGSGGFGPLPISNVEIEAYLRLNGEIMRPWEMEIVRAMDRAYMEAAMNRNADGGNDGSSLFSDLKRMAKKNQVNSRPMSPQVFDALFG